MKKALIATAGLVLASLIGGCQTAPQDCDVTQRFNHPTRPSDVRGWKSYQHDSLRVEGNFVLGEGESVDNGQIGIKIISLTPAKCSPKPEGPSAKIQFYKVPDQTVICESVFHLGNGPLRRFDLCGEDFYWDEIVISAINAEQKWIAFELGR